MTNYVSAIIYKKHDFPEEEFCFGLEVYQYFICAVWTIVHCLLKTNMCCFNL